MMGQTESHRCVRALRGFSPIVRSQQRVAGGGSPSVTSIWCVVLPARAHTHAACDAAELHKKQRRLAGADGDWDKAPKGCNRPRGGSWEANLGCSATSYNTLLLAWVSSHRRALGSNFNLAWWQITT